MSSTEVEKYSSGFIFSQQSELDSLENPENYTDDVQTARRINQQNISTYQKVASEPLKSHSREAYARRKQAKKGLREAKARTKEINEAEKGLKKQIEERKVQLEQVKVQERSVYVEQVKEQEKQREFIVKKEAWLSPAGRAPRIGMIEQGISLGYLPESERSWINRMKALEAPYLHSRYDTPNWKRAQLEGFYQGMTQKQWDVSRAQDLSNQAASRRQSASIKGAAAIVESGGVLGGKFTGTGYDENTGQLTGNTSANNWGGYGSKEAQQKALQKELAKSFQAHPTYFNKAQVTSGFSTGNQYFKEGKMIDPKSDEGKKIQQVLTTQGITKIVNEKQTKLYWDVTKAKSATEAWNIRSKAMLEDPRVGTFNYLLQDGKVTETSGTIGIATKTEYTREEGGLNKDSSLVFKSEYDPSVVPVDPGFKGIVDTTPQKLSFVGYTPDGQPLQGAPKPVFTTYQMPEILTLQDFARDQNMGMFEKATEGTLKWLDEQQKATAPKNLGEGILDSFGLRPQSLVQIPLGLAKEGVAVGATIMNLATQHVDPYLRGGETTQRAINIPQTALGKGFEQGFAGEDVLLGQAEYMKERGFRSTFGEYLTLYPGTGAVKPILKLTGSGLKPVVAPLQTTILTAAPLKGSIPIIKDGKVWAKTEKVQEAKVSDSITIFGKPVITKTLNDPGLVNVGKTADGTVPLSNVPTSINPVSTAGTWKLGKTSAEQVLQKTEVEPFGSGLEVMTGSKMQTTFNREVVKELIKQGKMSKDALEEMDLIIEGVTIAAKPKPQILGSYGAKPFEFLDRGKETITIFESLRKLQTSGHLKEARIGEIGGSTAMDVQLLPQYAKSPLGKLHDVDVSMAKYPDERSELAAEYLLKKFQTGKPTGEFAISGTKVKKMVEGKQEIVAEFLTKKDVVKGNLEAQTSGMRFGKKYKADTLFGFARKKVVEPTRGIEVQDLRDQLLSKASSAMSVQGSKSAKWKGEAAGDVLETLSETKYTINPPSHRSKDIVDLYKIFKTQAYKLGLESDEGKRLDEIAELYRAKKEVKYGKLDFTMPSKPTMEFSMPSSNTFSSSVSSAGSQSVQLIKPSVVPGTKLTSPKQDQMLSSSTTSKTTSPSIISKSVIRSPAVMSATISSATRSATSKFGSRSARSSASLTSKTSRTSLTSPTSPASATSPSLTSVSSPASATSFTSFTVRLSPGRSSLSLVASDPTSGTGRDQKGGMGIIDWGATRKDDPKPTKKKPLKDFIGNVSESSILGVYKRKELTYGKKRVLKLSAKDKRLQASAKNRLQFLKASDIVKKRKKKSNTQTVLGFSQPKQKKLTKKEKKSKVVRF